MPKRKVCIKDNSKSANELTSKKPKTDTSSIKIRPDIVPTLHGKKDGLEQHFDDSGKLVYLCNWKKGVKHGKERSWNDEYEITWIDGVPDYTDGFTRAEMVRRVKNFIKKHRADIIEELTIQKIIEIKQLDIDIWYNNAGKHGLTSKNLLTKLSPDERIQVDNAVDQYAFNYWGIDNYVLSVVHDTYDGMSRMIHIETSHINSDRTTSTSNDAMFKGSFPTIIDSTKAQVVVIIDLINMTMYSNITPYSLPLDNLYDDYDNMFTQFMSLGYCLNKGYDQLDDIADEIIHPIN